MPRITVWTVLLLLAPPAVGEEPPGAAPPLHFVLEAGLDAPRVFPVRLEASGGPGTEYDLALLDRDNDGEFETRRSLGARVHPRTKRPYREIRLAVRHGDALWTLELDALKSPVSARELAPGTTSVHWSVQSGDLYVRFLGATLTLAAEEEAARAAPFRMGPPLAFVVGAATRGPNPVVSPDLRGPNGGSLAAVRRGGEEVRPRVRILAGGEALVERRPGYS